MDSEHRLPGNNPQHGELLHQRQDQSLLSPHGSDSLTTSTTISWAWLVLLNSSRLHSNRVQSVFSVPLTQPFQLNNGDQPISDISSPLYLILLLIVLPDLLAVHLGQRYLTHNYHRPQTNMVWSVIWAVPSLQVRSWVDISRVCSCQPFIKHNAIVWPSKLGKRSFTICSNCILLVRKSTTSKRRLLGNSVWP